MSFYFNYERNLCFLKEESNEIKIHKVKHKNCLTSKSPLYLLLFNSVLVNLSCHNKMPILGGGRLTGIYFLTVLEAKVQIKVPAWSVSGEASLYGLRMAIFLPYPPSHGRERVMSKLSGISHYKGTNPIMRAPSSEPQLPPKGPTLQNHHIGV